MGVGKRHLAFGAVLGVGGALLAATSSLAGGTTIEAAGGAYGGYVWSPSSAETAAGGSLTFKNGSSVEHGVTWTGGPEAPACTGVPIDQGKPSWSGTCVFSRPGTYTFKCTVHPTEMTGTITVTAAGTTTPGEPPATPPPEEGEEAESPLGGPASQALGLARRQSGGSVRGFVDVSQAGVGGRLEVDLVAGRAALYGPGHSGTARVGRLVRSSLTSGRLRFAVGLGRTARRALARLGRLRLAVDIVLTPPQGEAVDLRRHVLVRRSS